MEENQLIFRCFSSGSSGNCYYLGSQKRGILIDAGISARTIAKHLKEMGLDFQNIMGVFVTHDHADHIRAVGTLGERFHIPIYTTREIHEGIDRNYGVQEKLRTSRRYFDKGIPFELGDMQFNTFGINHDSTDCLGYVVYAYGQYFMVATDCGEPNPIMEKAIAKLLADNFHEGIRNIFLCHLSQENNDPCLAFDTVRNRLEADKNKIAGTDYFLKALDRTTASPTYILGDTKIDETRNDKQ